MFQALFADKTRLSIAVVALGSLTASVLMWALLEHLDPLPPKHVVMVTGASGSGYEQTGKQYRALLAENGIDVELRASDGDVENLAALTDPNSDVDIGFLLGGLPNQSTATNLESLGTVFFQPLWVFFRTADRNPPRHFNDLAGLRMSIGDVRSGTYAVMLAQLRKTGTPIDWTLLRTLSADQAAQQLIEGRIDIAAVVTSLAAPAVQRLLKTPGIGLMDLVRINAFVAVTPFLEKVVLYEGAGDLRLNNPAHDVALMAGKSSLVVRRRLHPAIRYLLLDAAEKIHGRANLFHDSRRFPAAEAIDVPLCEEAKAYHKSGRPVVLQYLPFWLAALVQRLVHVLVPLVGVLYPLLRLAPSVQLWLNRRRIFAFYDELRTVELETVNLLPATDLRPILARLAALDERVRNADLPASYSPMLFTLRDHIAAVHTRLMAMAAPAAANTPGLSAAIVATQQSA